MRKPSQTRQELIAEMEELRLRLAEAEATLRAIRSGEVDVLVVSGAEGEQVFTLQGAEHPYRVLVEAMNEGAVTLAPDGTILYCNTRFAAMVKTPLEKVMGTSIRRFVAPADLPMFEALLQQGSQPSKGELAFQAKDGTCLLVNLSISALQIEGAPGAVCIVATDLTEQKRNEEIVAAEKLACSILEQAAEAIVACDNQGRIIRASRAAHRLCGSNPVLQPFDDSFPLRLVPAGVGDNESGGTPSSISAALQGEILHGIEAVFERRDGQAFNLLLSAGPLVSEQGILGCVVALADITERKRAEEVLRKSEARYRAVVEDQTELICRFQPDGRLTFVNEAYCRYFGKQPEELLESTCMPFIFDQDQEQVEIEFASLSREKPVVTYEHRVVAANGEIRWQQWRDREIYDENGAPVEYQSVGRDITERKRAEEALRESERKFRSIVEQSADGIVMADEQGNIIEWNPGHEQLTGLKRAKVLGRPVWEVLFQTVPEEQKTPAVHDRFRASTLEFLKTGQAPWLNLAIETEVQRPDGTRRVEQGVMFPIKTDKGFMCGSITRDITERKQAEEALRKSEARYRAVVEDQMDLVCRFRPDGRLTFVNEAYCRYFGKQREELLEDTCMPFVFEQDRELVEMEFSSLGREKPVVTYEHRVVAADGEIRWQQWRDRAIYDENGTPVEYQSVGRDITERVRAEEEIRGLNRDLERRAAELVALNKAAQAVTFTLNTEAVLGLVLVEVRRLLDSEGASVLLYEPASDELVFAAADSPGSEKLVGARMPAAAGVASWVMRERQAALVGDAQSDARFYAGIDALTGMTTRSLLAVPLMSKGTVTGVLETINKVGGAFTGHDLEMLTTIASSAAIAIENARLYEEVYAGQEQLRVLSSRLMEAQEAERRSMARELHDEIGQVLTAVKTNLQAIQLLPDPLTLVPRLEESIGIVDRALKQVRDLSLDLRPLLLDDFGLAPALEWYVEHQAQRSGFAAEFVAEPPELRLSPALETACFRVAQAALTNVARHARAKQVRVELRRRPAPNAESGGPAQSAGSGDEAELELVIRDDGVGFDVQAALERAARGASLGLLGMQERVRLVGGQVEIESAPAHGTHIRARFPIT